MTVPHPEAAHAKRCAARAALMFEELCTAGATPPIMRNTSISSLSVRRRTAPVTNRARAGDEECHREV
jgi:hypothetical protein